MRVLVAWDDAAEAELIGLYLDVDGGRATVCLDVGTFLSHATAEPFAFDALLMPTALPDHATAFKAFRRFRELRPGCPVIAACRTDGVLELAQFLRHGLRASVPRDRQGDFVFLLRATVAAPVDGIRDEAGRRAADAMATELDAVHRVQAAVLPASLPQPPGYRLAARCEQSRIRIAGRPDMSVAGGDYYDVVAPDGESTTVLLADATGHGLRACLSIVAVDALLRTLPVHRFADPAGLLSQLNRLLCRQKLNKLGGGYVTAVCVSIRHRTHHVTWATAGHPAPLLVGRETVEPLDQRFHPGPPLGVDETTVYQAERASMPARGRMLVYTDGLTEAGVGRNAEQLPYGTSGVSAALIASRDADGEAVLDRLFAESDAAAGELGRGDDTTAVVISRVG